MTQATKNRGPQVIGQTSVVYNILCDSNLEPHWQAIRAHLGNNRRLKLKACSLKHWQIVAPDRIFNIWPTHGGFKTANNNAASAFHPTMKSALDAFHSGPICRKGVTASTYRRGP